MTETSLAQAIFNINQLEKSANTLTNFYDELVKNILDFLHLKECKIKNFVPNVVQN